MRQQQAGIFEPSYRRNFIFKICFGFCLIIVACVAAFYWYFDRSFGNHYVGVLVTLEELNREMCYGIIFSVMVQALFFTLLILFISIIWTHKIAGPLFRLRHSFLQIASGNLTIVTRFRDSDQLQNIPGLLNSGLQQLRDDFVQLNRDIVAVKCGIEQLAEGCSQYGADETKRRLQDVEARLREIVERMDI